MVAVVVNDYSNQVKLNVVRYAVYGAVGHSTLAQRLALLLGDAVVGRLPTADATRLDLHEVQRVEVLRDDVKIYRVPCDTIAEELGNGKVSNMVMLGAYIAATAYLKVETIETMIREMFTGTKAKLVPLNIEAFHRGMACVQ